MSVAFWVTTIVIVATPGTGALYAVRTQVISRPRVMTWMRRVFAGTYVLLAGRLAVTER